MAKKKAVGKQKRKAKPKPKAIKLGRAALAPKFLIRICSVGSPSGSTVVTPYGAGEHTYVATGVSPVSPTNYLDVWVRHYRLADITSIPLSPAGAVRADRDSPAGSAWTVPINTLRIPNGHLNQVHVLVAWNTTRGTTPPSVHSIDVSYFTPTPP